MPRDTLTADHWPLAAHRRPQTADRIVRAATRLLSNEGVAGLNMLR
ncbi:hypothetical protein [Streptomyces sp. NPDC001657]